MKLSSIATTTIMADTANGLDGNIQTFLQTLKEEQFVAIRFSAAPGFFAAFIVYTR